MNPIMLQVAKEGVKGAAHWIARTLSVLAVLGIAWAIYAGIIRPVLKPNPSTKQEAEKITNYNYTVKPTFGCMRFNVHEKPVEKESGLPGDREELVKD